MDSITASALPGAFAGQDSQFRQAFQILQSAIEQRAFPGAALAVTHRGRLVASKGIGRLTYDAGAAAVQAGTIYDLASVTKVVATTAACMLLHQRGEFDLQQPVVEIIPEFSGDDLRRRQVTMRMLLAHSSGLPAYIKLFQTARTKADLIAEALRIPLAAEPGSRAEYSDIGFIVLGLALERISALSLDSLCKAEIFTPLKLFSLSFNPAPEIKPLIPPTINDTAFREKVIQGEVNDENAWVMGGVAGHAGCFGSAADVARFAEALLDAGKGPFAADTIASFTRRESLPAGTSRALGWDTPSAPSQSGKYFSPSSFGHLGYTGTSLWIDPERRVSVTLLTNRTWPDGSSQLIRQVRPAFHDAIIEALA